ncbi:MAG: hypothetical protein GW936_08750 [Gallionella sp.]|nr:hypothetical protein [Gallionella sp.]
MGQQNLKIGFFSDLHTEFMRPSILLTPKDRRMGRIRSLEDFAADLAATYAHCDVIVAAGDIGEGEKAVNFLRLAFPEKPVVYVMGNHDHWGGEIFRAQRKVREAAAGTNVHFLDAGQTVEIEGVTFCGATLWTDYLLTDSAYAITTVEGVMNDFRKIRIARPGKGDFCRLHAPDLLGFHHRDLLTIKQVMADALSQDKMLVVVTHHLPTAQSLWFDSEREYMKDTKTWNFQASDVCYASHLDYLFHQPDAPTVWIHGHSHVSVDHWIGNTRIVSNPRGYAEGDDTGWQIGRHVEVPL